MGEKAKLSRLSFEAVVALVVIFVSLMIHMVAFISNSWFWYREENIPVKEDILHTLSVWKTVICKISDKKVTSSCTEDFNIYAWARATAAFVTIALVIHLACLVSVCCYICWRRNKRFVFAAAIGMIISGATKCLAAMIWGFSASRAYDGWLDWSFALLLITMSLDWTAGLVSIVEHAEAKEVKPGQHRRQRITSVIEA